MVMLSKSARLRFSLNNQEVNAPVYWQDISINSNFENGGVQGNISTDSILLAPDETKLVKEWISQGKIFKGIPFKIDAYNVDVSKEAYNGFINCANDIEFFDDGTSKVNIQLKDGLNNFTERLSGITLPFLYSIGAITDNDFTDLKYVVEKNNNSIEIISNLILIYILVTQLKAQAKSTSLSMSNDVGHATGGATGSLASTIFSIAVAIIELGYTLFMSLSVAKVGADLFNMLLPILRTHKVLKLRTALEKISGHLGFSFYSDIELLDNLHYLPSNNKVDEINLLTGIIDIPHGTKNGIPNSNDYGYTADEFLNLCLKMFQAKIKIKNNTLYFLSENNPFWNNSSNFQLPNILKHSKKYNTNELVFSKLLAFRIDEIADEWTLINYKGTNYQIITDDNNITSDGAKYIKNTKKVNFNVALGNVKNNLNALENSLKKLAKKTDSIVEFFGGTSNLENKIKNRIGILKVGTNNTTVPKIIYLDASNKIPSNHRDLFSAKVLYDKFINYKSFVLNNFGGQKAIYKIDSLPFGLESFIKTSENAIFTDTNGNFGKLRSSDWTISSDVANVEIEQKEIYCTNLTETYIEVE